MKAGTSGSLSMTTERRTLSLKTALDIKTGEVAFEGQ
jgi:hypothetical protein